jgi:hypothetical protein
MMPVTIDTDQLKAIGTELLKEAARVGAKALAASADSAMEDVEDALGDVLGKIRRGRAELKSKTTRRKR